MSTEEQRFQDLANRVKRLGERDVFLLSRADLRLICRRPLEFWALVDGRELKPNPPADTTGRGEYM